MPPILDTDFVILGSGIAGLRAALELAPHGRTLLLTKDAISESATQYAQGGIAAALGEDDAVELHEHDTLAAGAGLCNPAAVRLLVEQAPAAIAELLAWGAAFDRVGDQLDARVSDQLDARVSDQLDARISDQLDARVSHHPDTRGSHHLDARISDQPDARGSHHPDTRGSDHPDARVSHHPDARVSHHPDARGSHHPDARGSHHPDARVSDRGHGRLERTREAAHSRSRILHAHGDSTGREIADTLARRVTALASISLRPHCLGTRLLRSPGGAVAAVEYFDEVGGVPQLVRCRGVLLATGGLGQIYADTTNPAVASGDGPALAYAAGAALADMEFVQFHPTALALPGAPRFLLSEALRGEGARLRNPAGEFFMARYHPDAELAPRDVVARALASELQSAGPSATCFMDATHLDGAELERRFPRITATLNLHRLDLRRDWIPVRPAAHYAMGGVATDLHGRTSLPGLYAAGECACTGVHGANRLASNSLLEGLVFGARAGRHLALHAPAAAPPAWQPPAPAPPPQAGDLPAAIGTLRRLMARHAGIIRSAPGLAQAQAEITALAAATSAPGRLGQHWHSLWLTASAVLRAALARHESRGSHFRTDFPQSLSRCDGLHSLQSRSAAAVAFIRSLDV